MREFSDFEKKILGIMVELQAKNELCRQNILKSYFENKVRLENDSIKLYCYHDSSLKKEDISIILLECGFLYSYLKSNYYIYDIHKSLVTSNTKASDNSSKNKFEVPNYEEYWIASYNGHYRIILSQTIVSLVLNDFKTAEQIRFEKQRKDTWIGIGVALGIGIIGIILNIIALSKDTNINKEQIKSIQTTIQENKVAIANDTLKVNNLKVVQHNDQEK